MLKKFNNVNVSRPNNNDNTRMFTNEQPMFDFKNEARLRYERRKGGKKNYKNNDVRW